MKPNTEGSAKHEAGRRRRFSEEFRRQVVEEHGSIPYLSCSSFLKDWGGFYRELVHPKIPVTVNVRNTKAWHAYRNSQFDCWLEFFRHCETHNPAKFIIICARSEIVSSAPPLD